MSAHRAATESLCELYPEILVCLQDIANDESGNKLTHIQALSIRKSLNSLEVCLISIFWNVILNRFDSVSKKVQSPSITIPQVVELYNSLIAFITGLRNSKVF